MPNVYEPLVLEIEPPYIGSAVSPTVDIDETADDITVTIIDSRGEHSYTVDKTDQAIADAEAAAANANQAAQDVQSAVDAASTAATRANQSADAADDAASAALAAKTDTEAATTAANTATSNANAATSTANESAANADANAALASSAASNADAKAALANTAATNADSKASAANTAAGAANTAATAATSAASAANTAAETANTAAEYASEFTEAYMPLVTAGVSETLLATDVTVDTFAQRTSDHDGACRITSLRGNTVRWNQLVSYTNPVSNNAAVAFNAGTRIVSGHKYALMDNVEISSFIGNNVSLALFTNNGTGNVSIGSVLATVNGKNGVIFTNAYDAVSDGTNHNVAGNVWLYVYFWSNTATITDMQLFDLTDMFGAGNEPATVEEFERQYPESYYQYDAGSLLSVNVEGIESAGIVREIPTSTTFPDGILRSAGTVYDERTPTRDVKRVGVVDLGTLNWGYTSGNNSRFYVTFPDARYTAGGAQVANINCVELTPASSDNVYYHAADKIIALHLTQRSIWAYDSAYTDAATFKAAMNGVMLYYELATPTETAIDPPLNLAYPTEQGGTESIVIPTGEQSAAPTMAVVYAYDADGVRDISQAIIATIEGATASTNYAIGGYFVHAGKLYKATSAIATGETINPGTNCIQTTVMAELVALTA